MSEIQSLLKRILHAGIDAVTSVGEEEQKQGEQIESKTSDAKEWIVQTDPPQEEGKQIVNNFIKEVENRKVSLEEKLNLHVSSLLSKMDLLSRNELLELETRLDKLEQKIAPKFEVSFGEEE